jgi:hypothetical protein
MKKKKIRKKLKKMAKRIDMLENNQLNQGWIAETIGDYHKIQGRLFRIEGAIGLREKTPDEKTQ